MAETKTVYEILSKINVNDKIEKKQTGKDKFGNPITLSYLSWAWAWQTFVEHVPTARYEIVKNPQTNLPYFEDEEVGAIVYTKVTVGDITHEMWLPVMDGANNAMKKKPYSYKTKYDREINVDSYNMFDINKTIMRCLVKNLAMFSLGIYIYAGEDINTPIGDDNGVVKEVKPQDIYSANATEKIRPSVALQLDQIYAKLDDQSKAKVDSFLEKNRAKRFSDLTQSVGQALLVNLLAKKAE
jgi:hypothetical protein